ncbi:MAG: hypothetical protein CFE37_04690 [Alphaproteobacteria bacterium PA4]|nr:MAG: hypothetical protein CFE37_04690 [Alphaproteobacteria bacterium PA4]
MTQGSILLGLSAAAALALVVMGIWLLWQPGGNRVKAGLMVLAGLVIVFNAWINSLPAPGAG